MKKLFYLQVPSREQDAEGISAYSSRELTQWLSDLPTANYGMTTRLLYEHLQKMIRIEMEPVLQLDALEALRPTVISVQEFLVSRIIGKGFPLSDAAKQTADLLLNLTNEVTIGYWFVLKELAGNSTGRRISRNFPLALLRVMQGLNSTLITHYLLRLPTPDWIWLDLHTLYSFALEKGIESVTIKDSAESELTTTTINDTYKQVLLLSTTDPYGLMQKEILAIYEILGQWGTQTNLESVSDFSKARGWVIYPDEDKRPVWHDKVESEDETPVFLLQLDKLAQTIQERATSANPFHGRFDATFTLSNSGNSLSPGILEYLKDRWAGKPLIGSSVFQDREPRLLVVGLKAAHQQLNSSADPEHYEWQVNTTSERTLSCEFGQAGQLFIGSLVGLKQVGKKDGNQQLGIVCRIATGNLGGAIQFEILALTPEALPAEIRLKQAIETKQDFQRALLYFFKDNSKSKTCLIVESHQFKDGKMVKLVTPDDSILAMLQNRKNIGLGYFLFECLPLKEEKKEAIPSSGYDFLR